MLSNVSLSPISRPAMTVMLSTR